MNDQLKLLVGRLLLVGLVISLILTIIGGTLYLYKHGSEIGHYKVFQKEPSKSTSLKIWHDILKLSSVGFIQMGILVLIFSQLLRVALLAFYYWKIQDYKFVWFSLFILAVMAFSLFSNI